MRNAGVSSPSTTPRSLRTSTPVDASGDPSLLGFARLVLSDLVGKATSEDLLFECPLVRREGSTQGSVSLIVSCRVDDVLDDGGSSTPEPVVSSGRSSTALAAAAAVALGTVPPPPPPPLPTSTAAATAAATATATNTSASSSIARDSSVGFVDEPIFL
jgi:hypothetical protein